MMHSKHSSKTIGFVSVAGKHDKQEKQEGKQEAVSKGEAECKRAIEELTGREFCKCRPAFLRNEVTGSNLELDLYNDEMKLAVEFNGRQHYEFIPFFHRTKEAFQNQRYRDLMKLNMCREHGVKCIVVPYTVKNIKVFIRDRI